MCPLHYSSSKVLVEKAAGMKVAFRRTSLGELDFMSIDSYDRILKRQTGQRTRRVSNFCWYSRDKASSIQHDLSYILEGTKTDESQVII